MHAIWTGPELSCPLPGKTLPEELSARTIPAENATAFPETGDIVLACLPAGSVKGLPKGNFFDIGIFYGPGGRLLMPFGWIQANVCAKVIDADISHTRDRIKEIQRKGVCRVTIAIEADE